MGEEGEGGLGLLGVSGAVIEVPGAEEMEDLVGDGSGHHWGAFSIVVEGVEEGCGDISLGEAASGLIEEEEEEDVAAVLGVLEVPEGVADVLIA